MKASIKITNYVDTRKKLDWEQTIEALMNLTAMPGAVSEKKQYNHLMTFIDAIANTIKNKNMHKLDNTCYAIPRDYLNKFFTNKIGQKYSDRFVKNCEKLLLVKDDKYTFNNKDKSVCKPTIGFNSLLLDALKLKFSVQKENINWKIDFIKNNDVKIITNLSDTEIEIDLNGEIINRNVTKIENISENEYFCIIQKIKLDDQKNLKSVSRIINTLKKGYNKLKTSALKQGRLTYLAMIENYIDELKMNNGYFIDIYQKKDCNRFFGMGVTLQCIKKIILEKLLKGQAIEIDQKSAHISIIKDFANSFNIEIPQVIKDYLNDTSKFIKDCMKSGKMRKKTVKTSILSSANGCINHNAFRQHNLSFLCHEIKELSNKLNILGIGYKEICNEETKRSENILIKSNNMMNLIRWSHDGVMILTDSELNLNLSFKTTTQKI